MRFFLVSNFLKKIFVSNFSPNVQIGHFKTPTANQNDRFRHCDVIAFFETDAFCEPRRTASWLTWSMTSVVHFDANYLHSTFVFSLQFQMALANVVVLPTFPRCSSTNETASDDAAVQFRIKCSYLMILTLVKNQPFWLDVFQWSFIPYSKMALVFFHGDVVLTMILASLYRNRLFVIITLFLLGGIKQISQECFWILTHESRKHLF